MVLVFGSTGVTPWLALCMRLALSFINGRRRAGPSHKRNVAIASSFGLTASARTRPGGWRRADEPCMPSVAPATAPSIPADFPKKTEFGTSRGGEKRMGGEGDGWGAGASGFLGGATSVGVFFRCSAGASLGGIGGRASGEGVICFGIGPCRPGDGPSGIGGAGNHVSGGVEAQVPSGYGGALTDQSSRSRITVRPSRRFAFHTAGNDRRKDDKTRFAGPQGRPRG